MGGARSSHKRPFETKRGTPGIFFAAVIGLSLPFWLLGEWMAVQLLPGLPIDALMVVCPAAAALILTGRQQGGRSAIRLLRAGLDMKSVRPKAWYLPIFLIMPFVSLCAFFWLRISGTDVPAPQFTAIQFFSYLLLFFAGAWCEEIGWTGYATDLLADRFGAFGTGLALGLFSVAYHLIPLVQVGRSAEWIFFWSLGTVALRVLIVWLYLNSGRSLLSAVLFHMTINVCWQLFPVNGSYYSPAVTAILLGAAALGITAVYGPRTLMRHKPAATPTSD
ncbi:CPBP family intramembrane metalloprotease [Saccharibacillus sp. CPCC 101409]|uniref:CPBP family intramembrane glutamic endopeptidase n=1 Tax=Saccharibacillus sp. CPCC 101409 TaxID=3058041 RepID=UPI00267107E3|nr:CPBP family intramembrane glutamic endopeptidase [Saccharibacillus sp. CPCC 101409]MDO3412712.1 CPBP family intramembrane metalloprotease [Saccharibacillus sp. CPCC 101409]